MSYNEHFIGVAEIHMGEMYYGDNTDTRRISDDNVIIVEKEFIMESLLCNKVFIFEPLFRVEQWSGIVEHNAKLLIFSKEVTQKQLKEFLCLRTHHIVENTLSKQIPLKSITESVASKKDNMLCMGNEIRFQIKKLML